jgi:hypothetical protein
MDRDAVGKGGKPRGSLQSGPYDCRRTAYGTKIVQISTDDRSRFRPLTSNGEPDRIKDMNSARLDQFWR